MNAGSGADGPAWKQQLFDGLVADGATISPSGPMEVRLAWRCSKQRNWTNLWKLTGDAMGPVLGISNPAKPFNPDDDRIVDLQMHLNVDDAVGYDVDVGVWWRRTTADL